MPIHTRRVSSKLWGGGLIEVSDNQVGCFLLRFCQSLQWICLGTYSEFHSGVKNKIKFTPQQKKKQTKKQNASLLFLWASFLLWILLKFAKSPQKTLFTLARELKDRKGRKDPLLFSVQLFVNQSHRSLCFFTWNEMKRKHKDSVLFWQWSKSSK